MEDTDPGEPETGTTDAPEPSETTPQTTAARDADDGASAKSDPVEPDPEDGDDGDPEAPEADAEDDAFGSRWWRRPAIGAAALVAVAVLAAAAVGIVKFRDTAHELTRLQQSEADRSAVLEVARDYAERSLNYSFENPDEFFDAVEENVSPTLKQKFVDATEFLTGVMRQAQVSSTGEVVAADASAHSGDLYEVVVSAYQTTRNLQNPEPRVSVILLQITVNRADDGWQVSDIGPKSGSHTAEEGGAGLPDLAGDQPGG
ncbi:hypothetical protein AWC30_06465 [Mycolicibacillus trivialis]|uniref:Mammalian cell entry protein n=2 Tax=Mycolicibacillus trivialis TaxID=1798 RepID=A0A1X2EMV0_9MYCO|nr:hypothetical protein AWC30_06465 [Mycolicibacillus trivialis]